MIVPPEIGASAAARPLLAFIVCLAAWHVKRGDPGITPARSCLFRRESEVAS